MAAGIDDEARFPRRAGTDTDTDPSGPRYDAEQRHRLADVETKQPT